MKQSFTLIFDFPHRMSSQTSQEYNRSIVNLWRTFLWTFGKLFMKPVKKKKKYIHYIANILVYTGRRHFYVF